MCKTVKVFSCLAMVAYAGKGSLSALIVVTPPLKLEEKGMSAVILSAVQ